MDLHPESSISHPQQTLTIPTPPLTSPPTPACLPGPSHSISATVGELLVMTILWRKEVTLCLCYLHSSWTPRKTYKVTGVFSSPSLECCWAGSAATGRSQFLQGSRLKPELKCLPLSGAVGSTVNFPVQQDGKGDILEIIMETQNAWVGKYL